MKMLYNMKYSFNMLPKKIIGQNFYNLNYAKKLISNDDELDYNLSGYYLTKESFTGLQYSEKDGDMPAFTNKIKKYFEYWYRWNNITSCFYKMETGNIMPNHIDNFNVYKKLFNVENTKIYRAIIFLEDWKSGHYFEINNEPIVNWGIGKVVWWNNDICHMAANLGTAPRYTLQLTGHV